MVERKKRGELIDLIGSRQNAFLKELCYLLGLARSGNKDQMVDRIVTSEYDFQYIIDRVNFLDFGLYLLLDHLTAKQLRGILKEIEIPTLKTKWDNMVEIIQSEQIEPSELLGLLTLDELEDVYSDIFEGEMPSKREVMTKMIIESYDLQWMEKTLLKGFIMMAMKEDPELDAILRVIKNECQRFDIKAIRIDDIQNSNLVTKEVIEEIEGADYLLVDLTHERQNVYYELGYGHGKEKDPTNIVLMAKRGTTLHFDIRNMRTMFWKDPEDLQGQLRKRLSSMRSD